MTSSTEQTAAFASCANDPRVVIRVRREDSLIWSLPIWLVCKTCGIPVELDRSEQGDAVDRDGVHLAPEVLIGSDVIVQLIAILETLHERQPAAGVWPSDPVRRAMARDACAGVVEICAGVSPFVLHVPNVRLSTDASLSVRLSSILDEGEHESRAGAWVTAAVAAMLPLVGIHGALNAMARLSVGRLTQSEAAQSWLQQPPIERRRAYFEPLFAQR
jgi:hypothetical protein